jgi:hypothetical protein
MKNKRLFAPMSALVISAALMCAIMLSACSNILTQKPENKPAAALPDGFGTVRVSVGLAQGTARTAIPTAPTNLEFFDGGFEYWFTEVEAETVEQTPEADGKFILEAGTYTLTVKAFIGEGDPQPAGEGTSAEFTIIAGEDVGTIDVTLGPIVSDGTGTLIHGLKYPTDGVELESYTLTRLFPSEEDDPIDRSDTATTTDAGVITMSGTEEEVPAGYYILTVKLENTAGARAGKSEVVHIYQNFETSTVIAEYTFTADSFANCFPVTVNTDGAANVVGSLRWAITQANSQANGGLIRVDEAGLVIQLTSALPQITKNIVIEGNGLTLTSNANLQLLYISATTAVVKISRVHFKDGRASGGAAIQNLGELTLESCIFSGNQTPSSGTGGAIYSYNGGNLTVSGCTFYNNNGGSKGGAIYFAGTTKTLTITGNLFYGNTATTGPVVCKELTGTTVTSSGYNVSDKILVVNKDTSGTSTGIATDIGNITALSVSPLTFRLLGGSDAAAKLPSVLPSAYPAKDFYGNAINPNGAVGAVQGTVSGSGYYLGLSVSNSQMGSVSASSVPDEDGLYLAGTVVTITAALETNIGLDYWLVNGAKNTSGSPLSWTSNVHTTIQAVFKKVVLVTNYNDTGAGSLREALTNAQDGESIEFQNPGETIQLASKLPDITKNIAIKGDGLTLTPATSWVEGIDSQMLYMTSASVVKISGVHFKSGRVMRQGGAIYNEGGELTLESCIFSDNKVTGSSSNRIGGAVYTSGNLTVSGCTFYNNTSTGTGQAIGVVGSSVVVTLTGNLFYGSGTNTLENVNTVPITASYNVSNYNSATNGSGWTFGTGDTTFSNVGITGLSGDPFNATSVKLLDSVRLGKIQIVPTGTAGFPATQFDGTPRTVANSKTAAGAWSTAEE